MELDLYLTEPQERFVFSEATHPGLVAGYGAGKSQAAAVRILLRALECPGMSFAFVEPTFDLVRLIAWPRFTELLDAWGIKYELNKGTSILALENRSQIIFRSGDNPERMVGFEVADAVIDEADTLRPQQAREVWNKMIARARQKKPHGGRNTVAAVSTPEGFGWMYETFGRELRPGYELIRAPTSSNPYLPKEYLQTLSNTYSSAALQAYSLGFFVNLTAGSVYPEFDRALNASAETIRPTETLHIGCDFNVTRMAAVVHVLRGDDPHAVDELTGMFDTPAMVRVIKERYAGHPVILYPDASGSARKSNNASESDIAILKAANFRVCAASSNPAVKDRVLATNNLLAKRRYRVNPQACPQLVESLEKQAYDKNGEPDKSAGFDHIIDAATYFIVYRYPLTPRPAMSLSMPFATNA